jgi:MFS family permease
VARRRTARQSRSLCASSAQFGLPLNPLTVPAAEQAEQLIERSHGNLLAVWLPCITLILMEHQPSSFLLYLMVVSQGSIGYALTSVMGPIVAEIFEGPHYGAIFGTITIALIGGGAAGPWVAGVIHDANATYRPAFQLAILCCTVSIVAVWLAAPRKVRLVPGQMPRSPTR